MSEQRLNVLFVDDEPKILDGLRRQLRSHREQWEIRFATSGDAALQMLEEQQADIVVSDMRMPRMTGAQLLARVRNLYPATTRMMLSGQTDECDLINEIGCIHRYLQKPCDGALLCGVIERTQSLAIQLKQPALRLAANRVTALPPSSQAYRALVAELTKDDASLPAVASLVAADPALTVKLMQLVNSAFFGIPCKVTNPRDAVVMLGLKTVHAIVVSARLFDFVSQDAPNLATISSIWRSSVEISAAAAEIAVNNHASSQVVAQTRLAGMLCLIGRAILLTSTPETYEKLIAFAASSSISYLEREKILYGATQDDLAAYALGLWAFQDDLIEALALQSEPSQRPSSASSDSLVYLHLARAMHTSQAGGFDAPPILDTDFISRRGFAALIPQLLPHPIPQSKAAAT